MSDQQIERGRRLIEQLVASGEISGFKDPRVALLWPFWKRVFSAFAGLRIVPLVLTRSPHEVAMSIFLRSNGAIGYFDALDVTAVHYRQMNWILESWAGERAVVRFDLRVFTADLHEAVRAVGSLARRSLREVYDASCRHHEPAVVTHEAERVFQRLGPLPTDRHDPANVSRLQRDAATRETLIRARLAETQRDAEQQARIIEQCRRAEAEMIEQRRRTEVEMQERIAALEHQIAAITATRTWQWHNRVLDMPAGRWLANVLRVAKGWKGPAGTGTKKARP